MSRLQAVPLGCPASDWREMLIVASALAGAAAMRGPATGPDAATGGSHVLPAPVPPVSAGHGCLVAQVSPGSPVAVLAGSAAPEGGFGGDAIGDETNSVETREAALGAEPKITLAALVHGIRHVTRQTFLNAVGRERVRLLRGLRIRSTGAAEQRDRKESADTPAR